MDQTVWPCINRIPSKSPSKLANFGAGDASEPFSCVIAVSRRGDWIAAGSSSGKFQFIPVVEEQDDDFVAAPVPVAEPAKKKEPQSFRSSCR